MTPNEDGTSEEDEESDDKGSDGPDELDAPEGPPPFTGPAAMDVDGQDSDQDAEGSLVATPSAARATPATSKGKARHSRKASAGEDVEMQESQADDEEDMLPAPPPPPAKGKRRPADAPNPDLILPGRTRAGVKKMAGK